MIATNKGYVVGADLGGTTTRVALARLDGSVVTIQRGPTSPAGGRQVVDQMVLAIKAVCRAEAVGLDSIDRIVIGVPGVVRTDDGTVTCADNIKGLDGLLLADLLARALSPPVHLENDVNLAAIGESRRGIARGVPDFVLLSIGTGVGMGIYSANRLIYGSKGAAGEAGLLPSFSRGQITEPLGRNEFERGAGGPGLIKSFREARRRHPGCAVPAGASPSDILDGAAQGDACALQVARRHAALVANAVLCAIALLNPALVVVGGGVGRHPFLLGQLRAMLQPALPEPTTIETSGLGDDAGVIGAVLAAAHAS